MDIAASREPWWRRRLPRSDDHPYLALSEYIARMIAEGELPAGSKLPSERQLEEGAGVARGTIRAALFQLESDGLIYRKNRSGWYVCPAPVIYDPNRWAGFMTYVAEQGCIPGTQTLSTQDQAAGDLARNLRIAPDDRLFAIRRRRTVDGRPVLLEKIFVSSQLAPGLLDHSLDGSLTRILKEQYGVTVCRNIVEMRPCALKREDAAELDVKAGTPGLLIIRTSLDASGRVVEYDHEFWRQDSVRIKVDVVVGEE